MIQAGFLGLMRAVELFHPGKGSFAGYAKLHILYEIQQAARNKRGIRRGEQSQAFDAEALFGHFRAAFSGPNEAGSDRNERSSAVFTLACEGDAERVEARQALERALGELPEIEAAALVAHLDGASTGEISALLGCKRDSVDAILSRALDAARTAAEDLTHGD